MYLEILNAKKRHLSTEIDRMRQNSLAKMFEAKQNGVANLQNYNFNQINVDAPTRHKATKIDCRNLTLGTSR